MTRHESFPGGPTVGTDPRLEGTTRVLLLDSCFRTRCCGLGHVDFVLFPVVSCQLGGRFLRPVVMGRVRMRSRVPCKLLPREQSWKRDLSVRLGSEEVVRFGTGSCGYRKPTGVCDPAPNLARASLRASVPRGTKSERWVHVELPKVPDLLHFSTK